MYLYYGINSKSYLAIEHLLPSNNQQAATIKKEKAVSQASGLLARENCKGLPGLLPLVMAHGGIS